MLNKSENGIGDEVKIETHPTENYTITGLNPWTNYLVCVRAATVGVEGQDAPCVNQTTDQDSKLFQRSTTEYIKKKLFKWCNYNVLSWRKEM